MKEILKSLTAGEALTDNEIEIAMEHLFSDVITDSEISAFLNCFKDKRRNSR